MSDRESLATQRRLFALLAEAGALDDEARDALLAGVDSTLADAVRELLDADAAGDDFLATGGFAGRLASVLDDGVLEDSVLEDSVLEDSVLEDSVLGDESLAVGSRVGPYRIVERLGMGGMGVVYLAEQLEPVERDVALKVLRFQLDRPEARRRFASERYAMGRLDHPNVAKILDAGTTPEGAPYLAMERIDGEPIVAYCDRRALSIEERLRLFVDVCRGVDHAHQKFLLHRDIKPSNVLVTEVDGKPSPKLIDFGIVKGLDGSLVEDAQLTGQRVLGTPLYMSPEALGLGDDATTLDTRSDVYSLGVLLYELLAGRPPWGGSQNGLARLIERRLREQPETLTAMLQALPATDRKQLGERRGTSTTSWHLRLRGDLDAIVATAISRRPEDRYASARDLAADIERFLGHRPVLARRPARLYRLRKTLRRHRAAVALVAALALGTLGTTAGLLEARRQAHEAIASRDEADQLSELMIQLLRDARPSEAEAGLSAQELLARGRELIESELASHPERRARFQEQLGRVYTTWGLLDEAEPLLVAAVETTSRPGADPERAARALIGLTWLRYQQERYEEARQLGARALDSSRRVAVTEPQLLLLAHAYLGHTSAEMEALDEAETHYRSALEILDQMPEAGADLTALVASGLAKVHYQRRAFGEALELYERALDATEAAYGPRHRRVAASSHDIAKTHYRLGRYRAAEAAALRALSINVEAYGNDSPRLIRPAITLGNAQRRLEAFAEAEASYRRALDLLRRHRPESRDVAAVLQNLGHMLALMLDRPDQGRLMLQESLALKEARHGSDSQRLVTTLSSLGSLEIRNGRPDVGERLFRRVLAIQDAVAHPNPGMTAQAWLELGLSLQRQDRLVEAREALDEALAGYRAMPGRETSVRAAQQAIDDLERGLRGNR